MSGLIDSHAHLTYSPLSDDLDGVLDRARVAGVEQVITIGTDIDDAGRAVALARRYENVFASVGIHPHGAARSRTGDIDRLAGLAREPRIVALGEMGLDYHYDFAPRQEQRRIFEQQLGLAATAGLPVIIHCREAVADAVAMLHQHGFDGRRVVFHCFTGTPDEADLIARHGWRISFTGIVTFKNSSALQAVARAYPADQLMLETDSPYLSPEPVRSRRPNEPAHVRHIAEFLARLRGITLEELAATTAANTREFFGLPHRGAKVD